MVYPLFADFPHSPLVKVDVAPSVADKKTAFIFLTIQREPPRVRIV